jgi:hypothetical protein
MQVVCGAPVEERCARYDTVREPAIRRQFELCGDARLAFELEAPNPLSRLAALPALGPLEMLRAYVDEYSPVIFGHSNHQSISTVYCRNLENDSPWRPLYSVQSVGHQTCSATRNWLNIYHNNHFGRGGSWSGLDRRSNRAPSDHGIWRSTDLTPRINIDYAQTSFLSAITGTVDIYAQQPATEEPRRIVIPHNGYHNVTVQMMSNGTFLRIDKHQDVLQIYRYDRDRFSDWRTVSRFSCPLLISFTTKTTSDETGNLFYVFTHTSSTSNDLLMVDIRAGYSLRHVSTVLPHMDEHCAKMLAYNGGNDLICDSIHHYSVRAGRWTILSRSEEHVTIIGLLDRPLHN